jgi:hypothetical protein
VDGVARGGRGGRAASGLRTDDRISPVVRDWFPGEVWGPLSPYFERTDCQVFVEAQRYPDLVERFPDEAPLYEQGYVWTISYGPNCIAGERGHHHLSVLRAMSPQRFHAARTAGCDRDDHAGA